jgi:preprotein translocase subunit SecD
MRNIILLCGFFASLIFFSVSSFSQEANKVTKVSAYKDTGARIYFEIIQDQIIFDKTTVKHAKLIENENGEFQDLEIELTAAAAEKLTHLTAGNIGKRAHLIFNNELINTATIQSPLGAKMTIVGFTKQQAQSFINSL